MSISTYNTLVAWGLKPLPGTELICISGPCAAESEEQVMSIATSLKAQGISALRAGVWKPRTRPGSFEGMGATALPWLQRVRRELGMKVATEIATPAHAEAALETGLDILWIGARTTANPFAVQELAEALKGSCVPIFVKNPVNPDLNLWLGAIERMQRAGLTKVAAILRGFSTQHPGELRNDPAWSLAVDFRQKMPQIPLLCDPSHIAGRRDKILLLSQQAIDLDCDGLMVEVHPTPDAALSDARQQLSPTDFASLLAHLHPKEHEKAIENNLKLKALRTQIDELDHELLCTIAKRMETVQQISLLKQQDNMTALQSQRWNTILTQMRQEGSQLGLPPTLVEEIARLLHQQALEIQMRG
ncbi:MAG: bifunctional 3-deoxy-7-phosphoheptulonate synthase/chorismate mutase type II [Victivallales bacterium]|nr:bifunctional 3-deoxy-7-phosphoheptulonate synthase/chorismate mutase type II [Victivallales bacterium]